MVFSSLLFIFLFYPVTVAVYFVLPKAARNYWLFIVSIAFFAFGEPYFVFIMLASILVNYLFALGIDTSRSKTKKRILLAIIMVLDIGLIFVYKYMNFVIGNINALFPNLLYQTKILLPIGISFFTFQIMSYVIDVYRGDVKVQKNPIYVGMYIAFFPQLIAGPIVRYSTIEEQVEHRTITIDSFAGGIRRFVIGFSKKVLLANTLSVVADRAFSSADNTVAMAWLGCICYAFQIFFDFAGYSEMAIGLGKMFGFDFLENFDYPYISASISEFWRRWHMSLGTWFRDYLYFPLGGSRVKSRKRLVFNLFVVWFLTGLWHGANWTFILWGILYFVLITFEKLSGYPGKLNHSVSRILYRIFTCLCVLFGWVLFRSESLSKAVAYMGSMFGAQGNGLIDGAAIQYLKDYFIVLCFAVLCSTPFFRMVKSRVSRHPVLKNLSVFISGIVYTALFLVSVSYLVMGTNNPFIYFNF